MFDRQKTKPVRVDLPLDNQEESLFRSFLRETGRKAGPWVRSVVLDAIKKEKNKSGSAA